MIVVQRGTSDLQNQQTLNEALRLASQGVRGLPMHSVRDKRCSCGDPECRWPGKHPRTRHGHKDASRDPEQLKEWWREYPDANLGVATGQESDMVVLDTDNMAGLREAERLEVFGSHGWPNTAMVRTRRMWHIWYRAADEPLKKRKLSGVLEFQGEGAIVLVPPSRDRFGKPYRFIPSPTGRLEALPPRLLEALREPVQRERGSATPLDLDGPPIYPGSRNDALTSIAGFLHDGHRSLDELTRDLLAVNEARCRPLLSEKEVRGIARKSRGWAPCKVSAHVTPEVMRAVAYLERSAAKRGMNGVASASNWKTERALIDLAKDHGREYDEDGVRGIEVSDSVRKIAEKAGEQKSTAARSIKRLEEDGLAFRPKRGYGTRSGSVVLVLPKGVPAGRSSPLEPAVEKEENPGGEECPAQTPFPELYRLRWGKLNPVSGRLLEEIGNDPGTKREDLAAKLGRKPDSLKKPLKTLVDEGLVERAGHGRYRLVDGFAGILDKRLEDDGSKKADRLDRQLHERQRDAWSLHCAERLQRLKEDCGG